MPYCYIAGHAHTAVTSDSVSTLQGLNPTVSRPYNVLTLQCLDPTMSQPYSVSTLQCLNPTVYCVKIWLDFCTTTDAGKSCGGSSGDPFLLACRFFDRECAGYLAADDLEEIAFMSSDGISRKRNLCHTKFVFFFC